MLSIDVGVVLDGWVADAAITVPIGRSPRSPRACWPTTREALFDAVEQCRPGNRLGDVSHAVQERVEARRLLRDPVAGRPRHRPRDARGPAGPELRRARHRPGARGGHGPAIEPMVSVGRRTTCGWADDNWAVYSEDGSLTAHFEHTVAVTAEGPRILTPWHLDEAGERRRLRRRRLLPALDCYSCRSGARPSPGPCAVPLSNTSRSRSYEGPSIGQADVREVQGHPPPRRGAGHLPEPASQAAAGVTGARWHESQAVNIPLNKRVEIGLTYIYGIGRSTSQQGPRRRPGRPGHLRQGPHRGRGPQAARGDRHDLLVEGDLRRERSQDVKRLMEIGSYRGLRHRRGLPVAASARRPTRAGRKGPKRGSGRRSKKKVRKH